MWRAAARHRTAAKAATGDVTCRTTFLATSRGEGLYGGGHRSRRGGQPAKLVGLNNFRKDAGLVCVRMTGHNQRDGLGAPAPRRQPAAEAFFGRLLRRSVWPGSRAMLTRVAAATIPGQTVPVSPPGSRNRISGRFLPAGRHRAGAQRSPRPSGVGVRRIADRGLRRLPSPGQPVSSLARREASRLPAAQDRDRAACSVAQRPSRRMRAPRLPRARRTLSLGNHDPFVRTDPRRRLRTSAGRNGAEVPRP